MTNEIIEVDVARAADAINASWRTGIEGIIRTGQLLIEQRARWHNHPGWWSRLIGANQWQGQGLLQFGKSHVYRLIDIAEDDRLFPHVGILPSDINTLFGLTRLSDEQFDQLLADGQIHPEMKRNEAASLARRAASRNAAPIPDGMDLRVGDCRGVLADIADNSVPLILTDPPYGDESELLYEWLAAFAARVLIPGGSLICYTGQSRLDRDLAIFSQHLRWWWLLVMKHDQSQRLMGKHVIANFKPVLWYVKDHRRGRTLVPDLLISPTTNKDLHNWGQGDGGVGPLIEHLTDPGELIVDPFAGTADWGRRAIAMGRRWIGADIAEGGTTEVLTAAE